MFKALFLMVILLAGLIGGPYISGKQGYVLVSTSNYNIEMSITTLVIFFVISLIIIYFVEMILSRFFKLSRGSYGWFNNRKRALAEKQTLEGLLKLYEGDYQKAERLMSKNAKYAAEPILNYIKSAEAAQLRGDDLSANKYLIVATEIAGKGSLVLELSRTHILLKQNKLEEAGKTIESLLNIAPLNSEVIKLAVNVYLQKKSYDRLDDLMDSIEKRAQYTTSELSILQYKIEDGLMNQLLRSDGIDGLVGWWKSLSKRRQHTPHSVITMIKYLIIANEHEFAYTLILDNIKRVYDENQRLLLQEIINLHPQDNSKLLNILLSLSDREHNKANDIFFNRAVAYLYTRNSNFTKAKKYIEKVLVDIQSTSNDNAIAAYISEKLGDTTAAKLIYENNIKNVLEGKLDRSPNFK